MNFIFLVIGLALLVFGANWLVDSASALARKVGLSEFFIGLVIVGFGTSFPELVVSLTGAVQENADVAVGNVLGSNIFNVFLILGATALVRPLKMSRENLRRDIPVLLGATLLVLFFGLGGRISGTSGVILSRVEGAVLLSVFAIYILYCLSCGDSREETGEKPEISTVFAVVMIIPGLVALIGGGELFVDSAVNIDLRKSHPAFRMTTAEEIAANIRFDKVKTQLLISYSILNHANGDAWKEIKLVFNGSDKPQQVKIKKGHWTIVAQDGKVNKNGLGTTAGGNIEVAPRSALILAIE